MRGMYLWNVTFKTKRLCLNALHAMILLYVVRAYVGVGITNT